MPSPCHEVVRAVWQEELHDVSRAPDSEPPSEGAAEGAARGLHLREVAHSGAEGVAGEALHHWGRNWHVSC